MADIKNIDVFQTVTSVSFEVEPNTDIININKVTTTGYSGVPNLQDVTDEGATTTNPITANSFIKSGGTGANVLLDNGSTTPLTSFVGTTNLTYTSGISNGVVNSNTGTDATIPLADSTNAGLFSATEKTKLSGIASGAEVNVNADWNAVSGDAQILNKPIIPSITGLATTTYVDNKDNSQQLQLNYLDRDNSIFDAFYLRTIADSGTVEASNQLLSSLAVLRNISYVNQGYTQQINADKFVKLGGAADEYLMADGSISYGGGGGGGATNLSTSQTSTNFTINSNTGTDATVPLGNGSLAGATLNDYTTAEKTKLSGIATGAEVNVNADWNATSGDAQILNKPTIPSGNLSNAIASGTDTYTATISGVTSYVDGAGYLIRFTNGNTTNCSININGLGARALYRNNDGQLIGGDIQDLGEMLLIYSSALSAFKCIGTSPNDIISYVTNAESITITKGQPVYAFGGTGDRMTVKLAYNTLDSTSAQTVGLVMSTSIAAGQKGYIITQGLLDNLSTLSSPFIDGDTVYLGATAGTITRVKPSAPNHLVYLGVVTTASSGSAGRMYVKPQNGYELNELHDVALTSPPTNNDGLFYETSTDLWKNKSIATALGYTPYNATNPSGYQTASQVQTIADAKVANTITNGVTTSAPNQDVVFEALALKANDASVVHLTGAETITGTKTFSSNIVIPGTGSALILSASSGGTVSGLTTTTYPDLTELTYVKGVTSAIQTQFTGKVSTNTAITGATKTKITYDSKGLVTAGADLIAADIPTITQAQVTNLTTDLAAKQDTLQNTVNIKSINGNTILGSGDLTITASAASQGAYTMLANNTASSAVPTEKPFENITNDVYSGTIVWTGGAAPTVPNHTYSLSQVGNLVTLMINLSYGTVGGTGLTNVTMELPSTAPQPAAPSSVTNAGDVLSFINGNITTSKATPTTNGICVLRLKSTSPNVFEASISRASGSHRYAYATIQYFV